jgi:hypothetical protein
MKKLMVAGLVAAALGSFSVPAAARTDVYLNFAPPAPRVEVVPAPRVGHVWVPGYWEWRGHRHIWVAGHYVRERRGYYYAPARWVERDGGWVFYRGAWRRDSDRDGVPDRLDRAPLNPYVR